MKLTWERNGFFWKRELKNKVIVLPLFYGGKLNSSKIFRGCEVYSTCTFSHPNVVKVKIMTIVLSLLYLSLYSRISKCNNSLYINLPSHSIKKLSSTQKSTLIRGHNKLHHYQQKIVFPSLGTPPAIDPNQMQEHQHNIFKVSDLTINTDGKTME